ncbi:MAG: DUF5916 domain-containing protein [Calditrichia bacterium]
MAPTRRELSLLTCFLITLLFISPHYAQQSGLSQRSVTAYKGTDIELDGKLNESIWQNESFASAFVQTRPLEGTASSQKTVVRFAYDDDALYIGATMFIPNPESIISPRGRRDDISNAERIIIVLDTYGDRRTAYSFGISATGTRVDYYHPEDSEFNRDYSFDPVWQGETVISETYWTAELKIPFSQLRFKSTDKQTWGLNINRWVPAINEDSYWVQIPQNEGGWSSRFGSLQGIKNLKPSRRLEVFPYIAGESTVRDAIDNDDPFASKTDYTSRVGLDLKMGIGPNVTLDATINPDFGQVEADPAEVNLSAFETFFDERRPFFTEGDQLLQGGGSSYYYSRRIGANPRGEADGDFVDEPDNTTILGATKITGRLNTGLSIGALTAITSREYAKTFDEATNTKGEVEVAPLSSFSVLRLQQEFGESASTFGVSLTGVGRDLRTDILKEAYNKNAFSGGADWNLRLKQNTYRLRGAMGFSHIAGDAAAIRNIQENSTHYFQRPDADHVELDTTSTSMNGMSASLRLQKINGEHWTWGIFTGLESPGFEVNDVGRLRGADDLSLTGELIYQERTPKSFYQNYYGFIFNANEWNFDGIHNVAVFGVGGGITWKNFWVSELDIDYVPAKLDDRLTRGGPLMKTATTWDIELEHQNNQASSFRWKAEVEYASDELDSRQYSYQLDFNYQPGERWTIGLSPDFERSENRRQYVETIANPSGSAATFGNRYIFATIDQKTIAARFRLSYAFSPDLTLELYAEPFNASGRFWNYGELTEARNNDLLLYGRDANTTLQSTDDEINVTEGTESFSFDNPDFNAQSFRSNLVMRWEWRPGSTFFLVWQQNREDDIAGRANISRFFRSVENDGDQFFAVKFNYWLPVN